MTTQKTVWEKFGIKIDELSDGNVKAYYFHNDAYIPSSTILGNSRESIAVGIWHARDDKIEYLYWQAQRELKTSQSQLIGCGHREYYSE